MEAMPRPRPPHLHRQVTRHGKSVWYVRMGKGRRTRIRAAFRHARVRCRVSRRHNGSPTSVIRQRPRRYACMADRTLSRDARVARFIAFDAKAARDILAHIVKSAGKQPYAQITRATIIAGRDRRRETPAQARHFLETMRGLFRWATDAQFAKTNPTAGVADPARPKNSGIPVWTEEQVAAYEQRWPMGTRQRVWLDVSVYRSSAWRRSEARTPARPQWRSDDQD